MPVHELTKVVSSSFEKLCKELTLHLASHGFQRTKKTFWTRPSLQAPPEAPHPLTVDALHLHRGGISHGAPTSASVDVRIHLAIRVLNDVFPAIALNGPNTDAFRGH